VNRRGFLRSAGAVAAASCFAPRILSEPGEPEPGKSEPILASLTVDESATLAAVPQDFAGLSYESAQLANPAFFSPQNTALIALFRELGQRGVLRLGGGTSEFTAFTTEEIAAPPPFDAVGPDTSKNIKSDTPITLKSLLNLRAFLDGANWDCLYGLNLGRGTPARAAEEAFYAQQNLGPRLIAFQLGNEPDAWRNRYRPATWSYADYWKEWSVARAAVLARTPDARFAGPDVSNKMEYVTGFARDAKGDPHVVMLTSHYYAMGPAGAPGMTIEKLLSPDPKLGRDLATAMEDARACGVPYRMSEGNSCWNGGEPGVSDTLASALWVVDTMLAFASAGCAGVNLHGGGNGYYTPIAGSMAQGFVRRPEFRGMNFASTFAGATLVKTTLACSDERVRAYAGQKDGRFLVLVINKTEKPVRCTSPLRWIDTRWVLSGPAIDATQGVLSGELRVHAPMKGALFVAPYTAVLLTRNQEHSG
jgi:hypothetical protein